jgi:hypothetical protein
MSGESLPLDYCPMTSVGWVLNQVPVDGKKVLNGERTNILDVKEGTIQIALLFRERQLKKAHNKLFDVFDGVDNEDEKVITWIRVNASQGSATARSSTSPDA